MAAVHSVISGERIVIGEPVYPVFKYNPVTQQIETHVSVATPDQQPAAVAIETVNEKGKPIQVAIANPLDNPLIPHTHTEIAGTALQRGQYVRKNRATGKYESHDAYYGSDGIAMTNADAGQAVAIVPNVEILALA